MPEHAIMGRERGDQYESSNGELMLSSRSVKRKHVMGGQISSQNSTGNWR